MNDASHSSAFEQKNLLPTAPQIVEAIVIETMRRRGEKTTEIARAIRIDRSHLGRMRSGHRAIPAGVLSALILHLDLDRLRLAFAADVFGNTESYFDPAFVNLCHMLGTIAGQVLETLNVDGPLDRKALFASLSKGTCEQFAAVLVEFLNDKFRRLAHLAEQKAMANG